MREGNGEGGPGCKLLNNVLSNFCILSGMVVWGRALTEIKKGVNLIIFK